MMTQVMRDFGVFPGEISSMAIPETPTAALQAGDHKYGSLTTSVERYLRWVHNELQGSRHVRHDAGLCPESDLIPDYKAWIGTSLD
jgi:hypothetical protein